MKLMNWDLIRNQIQVRTRHSCPKRIAYDCRLQRGFYPQKVNRFLLNPSAGSGQAKESSKEKSPASA